MLPDDEFYIGYERGMPKQTRRTVAAAVAVIVVIALTVAAVFVSQLRGLAPSRFEFGRARTFAGYLALTPAPVLHVADRDGWRPYWLVARGKFGGDAALGGATAGWTTLSGTLIERERWRMIEVVSGSVRAAASSAPPPPPPSGVAAEHVTLRGEIVDSKCFLGVMNPGERAVHRDCAVRCLDGGIPVMFAFQDASRPRLALLLGLDRHTVSEGAGRSVTLSGTLSGSEESLVFVAGSNDGSRHRSSDAASNAANVAAAGTRHPIFGAPR